MRGLTLNSNTPSVPDALLSKTTTNTPQSVDSAQGVGSTEYDNSDHDSEYGGDTALSSQANFASEFLTNAVEGTSLSEVNPKMGEALHNLRQLVRLGQQRSISHGPRFPLQRPVPPGGVTKMAMPSQVIVTAILKENRSKTNRCCHRSELLTEAQSADSPLSLYNVISALADIHDFPSMVRDVYFATEDFSEATFAIVNAGLYMLFLEVIAYGSAVASKAEFEACFHICRANLETCLLHMPLFMSTKVENVQALYFGVSSSTIHVLA